MFTMQEAESLEIAIRAGKPSFDMSLEIRSRGMIRYEVGFIAMKLE